MLLCVGWNDIENQRFHSPLYFVIIVINNKWYVNYIDGRYGNNGRL